MTSACRRFTACGFLGVGPAAAAPPALCARRAPDGRVAGHFHERGACRLNSPGRELQRRGGWDGLVRRRLREHGQRASDGVGLLGPVVERAGVSFTGANVSTSVASYVFGTLQSPPLTTNTFPNTSFIASDFDLSVPGFVIVGAGATVGLEHVTYSVASGTPFGPVTVSFLNVGTNTAIFNSSGTEITPLTTTSGTITVGGARSPAFVAGDGNRRCGMPACATGCAWGCRSERRGGQHARAGKYRHSQSETLRRGGIARCAPGNARQGAGSE